MALPVLRAPFIEDIPLAFVYNNNLTQQSVFCGAYIQTILHFASYKNFQLLIEQRDDIKQGGIRAEIIAGLYNISLLGAPLRLNDRSVQYSYPVEILQSCIMVPLPPELPKYMYVVWPLGRYIWTTLFLGIFYVALVKSCLEWFGGSVRRPFAKLLNYNVLKSIGILSFTANMHLRFVNIRIRQQIFYFLLLSLGFILSAYHSSHMTAYCMKPIFVPAIRTVSDLLKSKVKVIITYNFYHELQSRSSVDLSVFEPLLEKRSQREFQALLKRLNRSYAYVVTQHQWHYLNKQQRQLIQPYFRLTSICFESLLNAFPLDLNASFAEGLSLWVLRIKESGLWRHWDEQAFQAALSAKYARYFLDTYPVEPLNLSFFRIGWIVLGSGLTLSCLAMAMELLRHRLRERRRYYHLQ